MTKKLMAFALLFGAFTHSLVANAADPNLVEVKGRFGPLYEMKYVLTPANSAFPAGKSKYSKRKFRVSPDQFELFLLKDKFPIDSPVSAKHLVLRMPSNKDPFCAALGDKIEKMLQTQQGEVEVFLSLSPYVEKVSDNPLKLKLSSATVFI